MIQLILKNLKTGRNVIEHYGDIRKAEKRLNEVCPCYERPTATDKFQLIGASADTSSENSLIIPYIRAKKQDD